MLILFHQKGKEIEKKLKNLKNLSGKDKPTIE